MKKLLFVLLIAAVGCGQTVKDTEKSETKSVVNKKTNQMFGFVNQPVNGVDSFYFVQCSDRQSYSNFTQGLTLQNPTSCAAKDNFGCRIHGKDLSKNDVQNLFSELDHEVQHETKARTLFDGYFGFFGAGIAYVACTATLPVCLAVGAAGLIGGVGTGEAYHHLFIRAEDKHISKEEVENVMNNKDIKLEIDAGDFMAAVQNIIYKLESHNRCFN